MILKMRKLSSQDRDNKLKLLLGNEYQVSSSLIVAKKFYRDNDNHDYYWDSSEHNWITNVPGLDRWNFQRELKHLDDETMIEVIYVYDSYADRTAEDEYFIRDAEELLRELPAITT